MADPRQRTPTLQRVWRWLTDDTEDPSLTAEQAQRIDWARAWPFIGLHLACLSVFWVGFSTAALIAFIASYLARVLALTGFYHRYFSHRTFKTRRTTQFVMALLGCTAGQRGPLWWAAHHRHHHGHADDDEDAHSPGRLGLVWAHTGWFLTRAAYATRWTYVRDWARYPELRWLNRLDWLPFVVFGAGIYLLGAALAAWSPGLGTNGAQLFVWGFLLSTVAVYHATYTINSLAHTFGSRRFDTADSSRNNFWLSLITLGEGWHNNHHHYPASARQGFYWWELDPTWYFLIGLSRLGLIWDLRPVPAAALERDRARERA